MTEEVKPAVDWKDPRVQAFLFKDWIARRQRARTDLLFLCNEVLGYVDVNERVHGQIINRLQKFQGGTDKLEKFEAGLYQGKYFGYEPFLPLWDLDSDTRYNLILYPRGHLKSTIATIAHSIQWIINYPNIRIVISSGTGDQARAFLSEVKQHFKFNEMFRYLFPDFCPPDGKVDDFGNQEQFTVPCRNVKTERPLKEPTVTTISVGAVVSGPHYEVLKNDDLVDKENSRTAESIRQVNEHYAMLGPLVETFDTVKVKPEVLSRVGQRGWFDVIGTRYSYSDLYGRIIDGEAKKQAKQWGILSQSALLKGQSIYARDAVALWPERLPIKELQRIAEDPSQGPVVLASQYLQNPITDSEGLVTSESDIRMAQCGPQSNPRLYAELSLNVTIDLAGMEPNSKGQDNDYTVLNLSGYGRDGTLYFVDIRHGRFTPFQVIDNMFDLWRKHPRIRWFKIEKEAHARVLLPFLKAEMARRNVWLPIMELKRDNRTSKYNRIRGLQALFLRGSVKFSSDIPETTMYHVKTEIMRFPKYQHDDILDTMADALQDAEGNVTADVMPRSRGASAPMGWVDGPHDYKPLPTYAVRMEGLIEQLRGEEAETATVDTYTGF